MAKERKRRRSATPEADPNGSEWTYTPLFRRLPDFRADPPVISSVTNVHMAFLQLERARSLVPDTFDLVALFATDFIEVARASKLKRSAAVFWTVKNTVMGVSIVLVSPRGTVGNKWITHLLELGFPFWERSDAQVSTDEWARLQPIAGWDGAEAFALVARDATGVPKLTAPVVQDGDVFLGQGVPEEELGRGVPWRIWGNVTAPAGA